MNHLGTVSESLGSFVPWTAHAHIFHGPELAAGPCGIPSLGCLARPRPCWFTRATTKSTLNWLANKLQVYSSMCSKIVQ